MPITNEQYAELEKQFEPISNDKFAELEQIYEPTGTPTTAQMTVPITEQELQIPRESPYNPLYTGGSSPLPERRPMFPQEQEEAMRQASAYKLPMEQLPTGLGHIAKETFAGSLKDVLSPLKYYKKEDFANPATAPFKAIMRRIKEKGEILTPVDVAALKVLEQTWGRVIGAGSAGTAELGQQLGSGYSLMDRTGRYAGDFNIGKIGREALAGFKLERSGVAKKTLDELYPTTGEESFGTGVAKEFGKLFLSELGNPAFLLSAGGRVVKKAKTALRTRQLNKLVDATYDRLYMFKPQVQANLNMTEFTDADFKGLIRAEWLKAGAGDSGMGQLMKATGKIKKMQSAVIRKAPRIEKLLLTGPKATKPFREGGLARPTITAPKVTPKVPVVKAKAKITDPAKVQEIKNSILEGEMILRAGTSHGKKLSPQELGAVKRTVASAKAKIGTKKLPSHLQKIVDKQKGFEVEDVTPKGFGPEAVTKPKVTPKKPVPETQKPKLVAGETQLIEQAKKAKNVEEFVDAIMRQADDFGTKPKRYNPIGNVINYAKLTIDKLPKNVKQGLERKFPSFYELINKEKIKIYRITPGEIEAGDFIFAKKEFALDYIKYNPNKNLSEKDIKSKIINNSEYALAKDHMVRVNDRRRKTPINITSIDQLIVGEGVYVPETAPKTKQQLIEIYNKAQQKPVAPTSKQVKPKPITGETQLVQEAKKYKDVKEFVNKNIGDKKFNHGGKSVFHETTPEGASDFGSNLMDKSGLNVSTTPELALGQKGKGAIVEFDKLHLQADRGSFTSIKKPGIIKGITKGEELRLIGGSHSPTTVKSITLKPGIKLDKRTQREFQRFYNFKTLEDGSIKLIPKWLDNKKQQLTSIWNKAQVGKKAKVELPKTLEQALKHQIGDTFKVVEPFGKLWKSKGNVLFIQPNRAKVGYASWLEKKNFIENVQEAGNNIYQVKVKQVGKKGQAGFVSPEIITKPIKAIDRNLLTNEIDLLSPEAKKTWRKFQYGSRALLRHDVDAVNDSLAGLKDTPNSKEVFKRAIYGDKEAYNKLPEGLKKVHDTHRDHITKQSKILAQHIERLTGSTETDEGQLELFKEYASQVAGLQPGKMIKPKELARIIRNNTDYLYRSYDPDYIPTEDEITLAQNYFTGRGMKDIEAKRLVTDIVSGNPFSLRLGGKTVRISKGSYVARERIPEPIRTIMGERTDPTEVIPMTIARIRQFNSKYTLFKQLNKTADVSTKQKQLLGEREGAWKRIPNDKLAWGDLAGKYVSPDLGELLNEYNQFNSKTLRLVSDITAWNKMGKTVLNPANWVQQFMGNIESSVYGKNFILNPKNFKHYTKAVNILYGKDNSDFARKLVAGGGMDTTFFHSADYNYMMDYMKNPMDVSKLRKVLEKYSGKVTNLWSSIDQLFKVSSIVKNVETYKMPLDDAIEEMSKWFLMFSEPTRAMRKLQGTVTGKIVREAIMNPFVSFKMARNVTLKNIIKDKHRRKIWIALRASRYIPLALATIYGTKKTEEQLKKLIKKHPVKTLTGDITPIVVKGNVIPIEDRWDIYKLSDIFSPWGFVGQNIIADAINKFSDAMEWGRGSKIQAGIQLVKNLSPQIFAMQIELARLQLKKSKQTTKYMKGKVGATQKERIISGMTGVRPHLTLATEMQKQSSNKEKRPSRPSRPRRPRR